MLRELTRSDWLDIPRRREHLLTSDAQQDARRVQGNAKMKELAFALATELGLKYSSRPPSGVDLKT